MKIVVISGSPRKGRTLDVVRDIESCIKIMGEVSFEYIRLAEKEIAYCKGCHNCLFVGEHGCPHKKDDAADILEKMLAADGVIFSTPGYVFNMTAYMKNLFDRLAYLCHRPVFFDKKAMLVSNSSPWSAKGALDSMKTFVSGVGFDLIAELATSYMPMKMADKTIAEYKKNTEKKAKLFFDAINTKRERPPIKMGDLMHYYFMGLNAKMFPDKFKADYEYYKQTGAYEKKPAKWFRKVRINLLSRIGFLLMKGFVTKNYLKSLAVELED